MSMPIKQDLFRHRDSRSAGFNNLCTVVHRLSEEGVYAGEAYQRERSMGAFLIRYERTHAAPQANIDLSKFDALLGVTRGQADTREIIVGQEGYVVFHATGHHDHLHVTLTKLTTGKARRSFDSRRLGSGDMAVFRLWQPGAYGIVNDRREQTASLTVHGIEEGKLPDLTRQPPVRLKLTESGFEPAKVEVWPLQAVVIEIGTPASLTLRDA